MQKKRLLSLVLAVALCISMFPAMTLPVLADNPTPVPIYMDPSYSYAERAADLVGRMSPTQKGSQMYSQSAPAIVPSALGTGALNVPATVGVSGYTWWQEALHGYSLGNCTNSNSYPQTTSLGNTWNPDLYYIEGGYVGDEIRERANKISAGAVNSGNALNLTVYSPTVNMHRDPRWGRNEESPSEDPFLQGKMGSAYVEGLQGMDQNGNLLDPKGRRKINSTIKHYVANNSERNRLDGGAVTSLRALREYYTAPYRNVIKQADVSSVMAAYSTLNVDPCSWSSYLIETLLRQTFGFSGYMTGDCDSVSTIARHNFVNPYTGKVLTTVEQLSQAMAHGMDLECSGGYNSSTGTYGSNITNMLAQAVTTDKGKFTENQVDVSLERLMTARMQTGEWDSDNPYTAAATARIATQTGSVGWQTPERLKLIDDVNAEAVVMLKNETPAGSTDKILPLAVTASGAAYKVVIVGAWQTNTYLGLYSASQSNTTNQINIQKRIVSNITEKNPSATFTYLTSYGNSTSASSYTLSAADQASITAADAVIVVTGTDSNYSKEDGDRTSNVFSNGQDTLISNVGKLNPRTIAVMETCGPMQVTKFENDVAAILWSSYLGNRKVGFGDVITGKVNPSGKLTDTWYKNVSDTGVSDIPSILDYDLLPSEGKQGRTYMYFTGTPSYPFGYGLSYTNFEYSNLTIKKGASTATEFDANDTVTVSFDVMNTGAVKGKESTQLYFAQPNAPAALKRPIKRLEGFKKIELEPNETKTVTLDVKVPDLAFYDEATDRYIVDTGAYEIQVGASSANVPLKGAINVSGSMTIVPAVVTAKPSQTGDEALGVEERLIFDKGKIVNPKLTVSMNDESLFGYIIKQQSSLVKQKTSTPFPDGMTFSYSSNRPFIVSVTDGVIKTESPGVATITATATYQGVSKSTNFVVYVNGDTSLNSLSVNGTPMSGFSSSVTSYNIKTPIGAIPQVTATSSNSDAQVTITQAATLPGQAIVTVTDGLRQTAYTINFTVDTSLSAIKVDGTQISGYSPTVYTYNLTVPSGTSPQVDAAPNDPGAVVSITQAAAVPGQAKVIVTAGTTSSAYTVNFNVDTRLNVLKVNGTPVTGFSPTVYTYNLTVPYGTIPVVDATSTDSGAVVAITQAAEVPGQAKVTVTIGSASSSYTINFIPDTKLSSLKVNGTQISGFSPTVYTYNLTVPSGTLPQVDATPDDPGAGVAITQAAALPGQAKVTVTVGSSSSAYTVNFNVDTRLSSLKVNGTQISGFSPTVYTYNLTVPYGTIPVVDATSTDSGAQVAITQPAAVPGQAKVTVTIGSTSSAYTVNFNVDSKLSSLMVNGTPLSGFSSGTLSYNVLVPAGMSTIPQLTATPNDPGAVVAITQAAAVPGQATITVSIGAIQSVYTVNFSIYSNGNDEFNSSTLNTALWHWVNEDPATWSLTSSPGYMTISPRQGDFYGTGTNAKNNLLQNSPGDWTIETKFIASIKPHATYQQGGIMAYQDMDNYIKLEWEATSSTNSVVQACREVAGVDTATQTSNMTVPNNTLWLRMTKSGNNYTTFYSTNGTTWTQLGTTYTLSYNNVQVGLMANNGSAGTNTDLDIHFDYFHNTPAGYIVPVDKTALIAVINTAQALTAAGYTPASWALEQTALTAAIAKRDDVNATQLDVNTAHDNLQTAVNGLQTTSDKTALMALINTAQALIASNYTPATWTNVQTALNAAIAKRDDPNAAQADVDAAHDSLQTAISGLILKGPAAALTGNGSVKPGETFTVEVDLDNITKGVYAEDISLSYDPGVFDYVETTGANSNIQILKKDSSVSGTVRIIAANIGGVTGADTPVLDVSFKVKSGIQDVTKTIAVTKAKLGVMPDGAEIQADLSNMTISVSPVQVDKSALQAAITAAQADLNGAVIGTEPGKYPQAAADALQAAIATANAVNTSSSATQAQVDDAVTALNAAKSTFDGSVIPAPVINKSALQAAITAAQADLNGAVIGTEPGKYPQAAADALQTAIAMANAVNTSSSATQAQVDDAVTALNAAKATFDGSVIPAPVINKSALQAAITAAQADLNGAVIGTEPGKYPQAAADALQTAIATANAVNTSSSATQAQVDDAVTALNAAKATFDGSVIPTPVINKSALQAAITAAQADYNNAVIGTDNGQYWSANKVELQAALDAANTVYTSPAATQTDVDNAVTALNSAKAAFEASVISAATGDINNNGSIDIVDLASVAYYYNLNSASGNWATAKIADVNNDGVIDILDLAFIASRIQN